MNADRPQFRAFVQARLSSRRFPGKVLAPLRGTPVLGHVFAGVRAAGLEPLLVTSERPDDAPLVDYAREQGVATFRGPLEDVLGRFARASQLHPSTWVVRLSADSPLLDPALIQRLLEVARREPRADLVTNVFPRSFARGRSVEVIRRATLLRVAERAREPDEREHVTRYLYQHPEPFRIVNVSAPPGEDTTPRTVDTPADLRRLEREFERLRA